MWLLSSSQEDASKAPVLSECKSRQQYMREIHVQRCGACYT